jgi:hypothetical protein
MEPELNSGFLLCHGLELVWIFDVSLVCFFLIEIAFQMIFHLIDLTLSLLELSTVSLFHGSMVGKWIKTYCLFLLLRLKGEDEEYLYLTEVRKCFLESNKIYQ